MLRILAAMSAACLAAAVGQILVRRGMIVVGPLDSYAPLHLLAYFGRALANPYVIGGTALNAAFYFLFLAALSWTNVTVALPLTALEYAAAAVLSVLLLNEAVPPLRWAGIGLVILGVAMISYASPAERNARPSPVEKGAVHEHRR